MKSRVTGQSLRVMCWSLGARVRVWESFRASDEALVTQAFGFRVQGFGSMSWDLGFRVLGFRVGCRIV